MPSLALLNEDGTMHKKLQLVSLPEDYKVPEGKILSWKDTINRTIYYDWYSSVYRYPVQAYFYKGSAWASVSRDQLEDGLDYASMTRCNKSNLIIVVQGTSAKDLTDIRDYILDLITKGRIWEASNDLNPKTKPQSFFQWLLRL